VIGICEPSSVELLKIGCEILYPLSIQELPISRIKRDASTFRITYDGCRNPKVFTNCPIAPSKSPFV